MPPMGKQLAVDAFVLLACAAASIAPGRGATQPAAVPAAPLLSSSSEIAQLGQYDDELQDAAKMLQELSQSRWLDTDKNDAAKVKKEQTWRALSSPAGRAAVKRPFPQFTATPGFQRVQTPRRLLRVLVAHLKRHRQSAVQVIQRCAPDSTGSGSRSAESIEVPACRHACPLMRRTNH